MRLPPSMMMPMTRPPTAMMIPSGVDRSMLVLTLYGQSSTPPILIFGCRNQNLEPYYIVLVEVKPIRKDTLNGFGMATDFSGETLDKEPRQEAQERGKTRDCAPLLVSLGKHGLGDHDQHGAGRAPFEAREHDVRGTREENIPQERAGAGDEHERSPEAEDAPDR